MTINTEEDIFGKAVLDYYKKKWQTSKIRVFSTISSNEKISPSYLFRPFKKMPEIEQFALNLSDGRILDVGACAGSHSLYLQNKGLDVQAIDISPGCCQTMRKRGVERVDCIDFFKYPTENAGFDTILLLMNGIGIAGTISGLQKMLLKAKELLSDKGKILFDSSDIDYAYYEKDGSKWVNLNSNYYGEVQYSLEFKGTKGSAFDWLFIDPNKMDGIARECGFQFKLMKAGKHFDYLGELRIL